MKLFVVFFISFLKLCFCQFEVPEALVEVFEPRGLRVSIPHVMGITLFAFHGQVNKEMNGREGGTFSKDIRAVKNGRWTFYDAYAKLNVGDILYYWTYVDYNDGTHTLGYTDDDRKFVVNQLLPKDGGVTMRVPVTPVTEPGCKTSPTTASNLQKVCSDQLIFDEDFKSLQKNLWSSEVKFAGSPDFEFVVYTRNRKNLQVKENHLRITPIPSEEIFGQGFVTRQEEINLGDNCTGIHGTSECVQKPDAYLILPPVASAQISTKYKFSFKYGKVEIRAKLPRGDWIYPELYLNPVNEEYGSGYASGQIRIAFLPGNQELSKVLKGGCILGSSDAGRTFAMKSIRKNMGSWCDVFHKFTLVWKPDQITVSVDDTVYGNIYAPPGGFVSKSHSLSLGNVERWRSGTPFAPFDKEMYLTIGVGVGGHSFEDRSDGTKPWVNSDGKSQKNFFRNISEWRPTWTDDSVLDVDYVKVWAV